MSDQTPNSALDGQQWPPGQPVPRPGPPGSPGSPVLPSKGLPGWAWALIVVGGVMLIGIIVTSVVVALQFLSRPEPLALCDVPGADGCGPLPIPTESATTEPSTEPILDFVSIDDLAEFDGTIPIWGLPILDGWEITIFDQGGINQMVNPSNGCQFTSSQNVQEPLTSNSYSDFLDTQLSLESIEEDLIATAQESELVSSLGSTEFALDIVGSGRTIEFLVSRVDYLNLDTSTRYAYEIAVRAMPEENSLMYLVLACPTDLVDSGNSPFEEIRAELAVLHGF